MNLPAHDRAEPFKAPTIPVELRALSGPSFLLPGENRWEFEMIQKMMIEEVRPESNIEWLWTLDLIELSWEILRYRRLKQRVLTQYRHAAIKAILLRLDGAGIPVGDLQYLELQVGRSAAEWPTIHKPPMKSMRACDVTASTTAPSTPSYFARREGCSACSTTSCMRHRIDAWSCCGK